MAEEMTVDDVVRKGQLLDTYGALLTERQQICMHLYYDMNLSLSEIAEELHVSRQSVNDMIRRTSKALEHYDDRLQIVAKTNQFAAQLQEVLRLLEAGSMPENVKAQHLLRDMLSELNA